MNKKYNIKIARSLIKSITFRVVIIIMDLSIIYLLTHRLDITLGVTIFTNIGSTILYFLHERVWSKINWGRTVVEEIIQA